MLLFRTLLFAKRLLRYLFLGGLLALGLPGLAWAATCAPAATRGTAPADFRDYCWLDFTGYNDATARSASGQNFTFNLPDGATATMNVKAELVAGSASTYVVSTAVPSWSGSAFGNAAFSSIPGRPILYTATNGTTIRVTLSNISITPPAGGTTTYSVVVADGESSNANETLSFTTNGGAWQQLAQIQNGSSTLYPGISGVGTTTVNFTGVSGTVGSYVFRSANNPTQIVSTFKGSGLQGIIIGLRHASISVVSQFGGARYNAADQLTYSLKSQTGTTLSSGTTSGTALNGFAVAAMPSITASYPFVVSQEMASGSYATLANYTVSLTCTNAKTGSSTVLPVNAATSSYTIAGVEYGDSILCTFTNTPVFQTIHGTVYQDTDHDGTLDNGEPGPGISGLYVKRVPVSGGTCTGSAAAAAAVNSSTGAYTLSNVPGSDWCLVLDNNNTLSDITPNLPSGWRRIETPTGSRLIAMTGLVAQGQNFGLFRGARLTGTVFLDTGVGGGTANDGMKNGTEPGLANVIVKATDGSGTTIYDTAYTNGSGAYELWIPGSATGTVLIVETNPGGFVSTGGQAGTTGGTYARTGDVVSFTPTSGSAYSGVDFGDVPENALLTDGVRSAPPDSTLWFTHTFTAGTAGSVSFAASASASPAISGWSEVIYRDANCNGTMYGTEGATPLTGALAVAAGESVCLLLKQFVPATASHGAQNRVTLTASFTYSNASPALNASQARTDLTTVSDGRGLTLQKSVDKASALPGEVLTYTIVYTNNANGELSSVKVHDSTPAFTTFTSAQCLGTLPASLTGCSVSVSPSTGTTGSIEWTLTGTLVPGGSGSLRFAVTVDP